MPKSVKIVRRGAFSVCSEMEKVEFSENLELLEERAFEICAGLKTVTLPYTLNVSSKMFYECNALYGIELITGDSRLNKLFVPYEPKGLKFIRNYKGGSIDFSLYDGMFSGIKKFCCKRDMALFRLKNPVELTSEFNEKYTGYLKRYSKRIIDEAIKDGDFEIIGFMGSKNLIMKNHIEEYIKKSSENGGLCTGYFIDYRNKNFGQIRKRFVL